MEHNIRIVGDEPEEGATPDDGIHVVEAPDAEDDQLGLDGLTVEHADGGVTVSLNGKPLIGDGVGAAAKPRKWFANLVEDIPEDHLGTMADNLLRGVDDDLTSRAGWLDDRAQGIRLLGLKIEQQGTQGSADGAPLEGMSKVRHPLLLEAVLRFQANARSELLPTDGPVKVRDDGQSTVERNSLADYLQRDMNHYLTTTAMEYYPDTDRMLLMLGFGGTAFKKVFYCPLRQRPVSDSVDAKDLIVNNEAVSLETAKRVTHAISMKASTVKRMQILGAYRDVALATPMARDTDAVDEETASQQGIDTSAANPEDRDRQIYEIYCELDIPGFEHKDKSGKETGLEIPYIVTIDRTSREVLAVVRNYNEDTAELPETRKTFVKYQFVPGLGFYDIGLLHILGNTTVAVTAAWREALDAGMFANFPGFLFARQGARQDTTQFRVPPGGGAPVDTGGMPINQAVMPLPYKEAGPGMMQLIDNMVETGQRVGSTSELQVGEGRSDAPVGTTLALIEQAMKILNAVHKRMHTAQDLEFKLLVECFKQNPESFWKANKRPATQWEQQMFLTAINDYDLVPKADPNTASHSQRILKVTGLKQLAAANPDLYDMQKVDTAVLSTMGWSNPAQFYKTPDELAQPSPVIIKGMADMKVDQQEADAKTMMAQAAMIKAGQPPAEGGVAQPEDPTKEKMVQLKSADLLLKARKMDADVEREEQQDLRAAMADENRDKDRVADLTMEQMRLEKEREDDARDHEHEHMIGEHERHHERTMEAVRLAHEVMMAKRQQENDLKLVKARPHGGNK